ncbi:unnamed protein product [Urochloa decumbens]|uniref:Uncharacterized protein n=1 Tax=Urochloa decumbens TaxID=240449 RepID=A0ABC8YM03_9POAL
MAKLTALTIVVLVAVAAVTTIVSSAHGARTLEAVAIPASFVATPPAVDDVDFNVPLEEEAADGNAAAGPNSSDWDDKTPVSGQ